VYSLAPSGKDSKIEGLKSSPYANGAICIAQRRKKKKEEEDRKRGELLIG
jgi:hypothetical protein